VNLRCLPLLLLLAACDAASDTSNPTATADAAGDVGPRTPDRGVASVCENQNLAAQCPVGSNPRVITEGCVEGAEFIEEDGTVTGVCARAGECIFACDFQDPCPCGIDRITPAGVFCTDCREAAACGDAVCDRGENPQICAVDCGETCVADNERCTGNARQECEENGRWTTLGCRQDQLCQFGQASGLVVTVCQTRISPGGGTFPGLGTQEVAVTAESTGIRFRERSLRVPALRFVEDGARVLAVDRDRVVILDPTGATPDQTTNIVINQAIALSPTRVVRAGRWPQLSEFFDDTGRNVEAMVHDGAQALGGGLGLSADDRWLAAAFSVGLEGGPREPVLGLWRTTDGRLDRLLRYVDEAVIASQEPATAVAVSLNGAVAFEARPGGVVLVWNIEERKSVYLLQSQVGRVTRLVTSTAGDDLLLVGGDLALELWSMSGAPTLQWRRPGRVVALALSPDSQVVAVGDAAATQLLDAADARAIFPIGTTGEADFDPHGGRLLVGNAIYTFQL